MLKYFNKRYAQPLNGHQLAIHGSGAKLSTLTQKAQNLGMTICSVRNNPFDMVPNIAGRNGLSLSSLARSLKFCGLVTHGDVGESPHTLPYLGIETYQAQLRLLGQHEKAEAVARYMSKHCV